MMSNTVHSYDKNTRVAMVACTPQPVTSSGSNGFDKDSLWQPYTLGYMDIPWPSRVYGYCTLWRCLSSFAHHGTILHILQSLVQFYWRQRSTGSGRESESQPLTTESEVRAELCMSFSRESDGEEGGEGSHFTS